jgi:hypothetical protein
MLHLVGNESVNLSTGLRIAQVESRNLELGIMLHYSGKPRIPKVCMAL